MTGRRVLVGIILCLLIAGPMLVAWRLSRGPIMVPWIAERVSAAITPAHGALTVTAASASIGWDSIGHGIDLRLHTVDVRGPDHETLMRLPTLGVQIDAWALARGRVAAREVELLEPRVTVVRSADGTFDLDLGDAAATRSDDTLIETATAALRTGSLRSIAVRDGALTIMDEGSRSTWTADHVRLGLHSDRDGLAFSFGFEIPMPGTPATISGEALHRSGYGVSMQMVLAGIVPGDLASTPPLFRSLDVPVAGTVQVKLDDDLRVLEATTDLSTNRGSIRVPDESAHTIAVERMAVRASYARESDSLTVGGDVRTETGADLDLKATFTGVASTPIGTITLTTDELTPAAIADLWPHGVAEDTRRWLMERVTDGRLGLNALLDWRTPSPRSLRLRLDLAQAEIDLSIAALAKRPGEPGTVDTTLTLEGGRVRSVDELRAQVKDSTVTGRATRRSDGAGWETARIEALLATSKDDGQPARCTFDLSPGRDGSRFRFTVDDLGHFVQKVGERFAVRGGSLTWQGTARLDDATQRIDGEIEASSYVITRSPQLARIATLSSISGLTDALLGEGISIDETHARLTYRSGRLRLEDGFMTGPSLALYAEGSWDLSGPTVDLEGDLAPSYFGTNRALNRVPLVGKALTGGGKGISAVHFDVRGPAADPEVSVHTITSLAPGPLRRLLQRITP